MKILTIIMCVVFFTVPIFLIARFGTRKKETIDYVSVDSKN